MTYTEIKRIENRLMALDMQTNDHSSQSKEIVAEILECVLNLACQILGCEEIEDKLKTFTDVCRSEQG